MLGTVLAMIQLQMCSITSLTTNRPLMTTGPKRAKSIFVSDLQE